MKKIPFILFITFLMHLSSTAQSSKENNFAQEIIKAFKSRSYNEFKHLNMDKKDFQEFIIDMQKNALFEGSNDELIKAVNAFEAEADSVYKHHFQSLVEEGEKIGIDWSQIKQGKFVYKTDKPGNTSKEIVSGHLNFQCKDITYVFFGVEAVELSTGYKINTIRAVLKGGIEKYVNPDLLEESDIK